MGVQLLTICVELQQRKTNKHGNFKLLHRVKGCILVTRHYLETILRTIGLKEKKIRKVYYLCAVQILRCVQIASSTNHVLYGIFGSPNVFRWINLAKSITLIYTNMNLYFLVSSASLIMSLSCKFCKRLLKSSGMYGVKPSALIFSLNLSTKKEHFITL